MRENPIWLLDSNIHYLNHGSYGATPIAVLAYQTHLRQQLERNPLRFFARELEELLDNAKTELAAFIGANKDELAFVANATTGVNTVLRSLDFKAGDEILITNHIYNACRNAVEFVAQRTGVEIVTATVPFPLTSQNEVVEAILKQVSFRTKLALIDHVSSQTALIFPIESIVRELNTLGIDTLVDGAHAPGLLPLNLTELNAAYYTGNCHKWLCAPKGAAFLSVRTDKQAAIRPLVISHGANSPRRDRARFALEFAWTGTDDPTPYLCVPKAIQVLENLVAGGWPEIWQRNYYLALVARQFLCETLEVSPPCPDEMIRAMASVPLANGFAVKESLEEKLRERGIEVPVFCWQSEQWLIRISVQLYNQLEQYHYLADVLKQLRD